MCDTLNWPRRALLPSVAIVILSGASPALRADPPLLDDGSFRIDSRNKKFFASRGTDEKSLVVYRNQKQRPTRLWEMPGWPFVAFLSDDGNHLVTANDWDDWLELGYKPDQVMLSFYRRGQLLRHVLLNELLLDTRHVYRTNSHFFWGHLDGFVAAQRFAIDTVEQRRIIFDATSGAVVEVTRPEPSSPVREPPGVPWNRAIDGPSPKPSGRAGGSPRPSP